ncbi:FdrA family protein [Janibacter corallicola]|uniref:FdrA family protein n=1 Tax=Janibacter corallicola TaxID=415212 RepID=UPI000835C171|nr:FdrA family protein [Janibacter corallicola]
MTSTTDPRVHVERRPGAYADSVALLQVSKDVAAVAGVRAAQVAMATPLNLDVIASMGFELPETTPNDMVVAIRLEEESALEEALAAVDTALAAVTRRSDSSGDVTEPARTVTSAMRRSDSALALVSVPGANAVVEAMDAIDAGHDVMVFSDNVPLDQEVALKQLAAARDLLVMGPDCGTAMIDGIGLGFANSVRPGPVGLVAASGTGCQQLMCLLDHAGVGMSAALGVGGRDLSAEVDGLATRQAMRRLDADPATELIVVVSKPPAEQVEAELRRFAETLGTPVHFALLGPGRPDLTRAAATILTTLERPVPSWPTWGAATTTAPTGHLRGLFAGGTLCDEAMIKSTGHVGPVYSNIPLDSRYTLDPTLTADGTVMIDFGEDSMTAGRAHPMIDPTIRLEHLAATAEDPRASVVLMDIVLGHGADADPAASAAPAIRDAIATARADGRDLVVLVSCIGTSGDPQVLDVQATALAEAGAEVFLSNAQAVDRALSLIGAAA